ncbi:DUF4386 domain-containing protein [Vallitalea okinawensis]|uniref:DUF4386 domain-containing protein n=1 Tax=Vallitalea okinawensis TaxID=2078660 RepID=UPI000CFD81B0|nr:DUF4386 domain-containing protein [Vallitalea okinawensis]
MNNITSKMKKKRKTSIIVGVLILIAYCVLASTLIESKILVMLFEVISGIAVIGISVLMFPIFKPYNNRVTVSYLLLKIIEGSLMIIAGILFLASNDVLFGMRDSVYTSHTYIFIISAYMFYYLLYKSKIIPRWISVWGVIAVILLLIVNLMELTNNIIPMLILGIGYSQIMLNEVFLAIWLMVKGFNPAAIGSDNIES